MSRPYHVFMMLLATPHWLALRPEARHAFMREELGPILERHASIRLRYFDCEFFAAHVSDIALWEVGDLTLWRALVEELRETHLWNHYFEVKDILLSVENAYADHYDIQPLTG